MLPFFNENHLKMLCVHFVAHHTVTWTSGDPSVVGAVNFATGEIYLILSPHHKPLLLSFSLQQTINIPHFVICQRPLLY